MTEQEIVIIDHNAGDIELLNQAFEDISFSPLIKTFSKVDDGLRYLRVRFTAGDIPPPHLVILSLTPHDDCVSFLQFMNETKLLDKVPIILFGDIQGHPSKFLMSHMTSHPHVTNTEYPVKWKDSLKMARLIADKIQNP